MKKETDIVARPQDIHSMTKRYDKEMKSTDDPLVLAVSILTQVEREYDEDEKKDDKKKLSGKEKRKLKKKKRSGGGDDDDDGW